MRGIDMATTAAGVTDGERQVVKANQRDRMREMLDRNGVLPPEPQQEAALAPVSADLGQIAADEQEQMEGYHGLTTDDASGMKMFCAPPPCPLFCPGCFTCSDSRELLRPVCSLCLISSRLQTRGTR
jgi:hypothetical protein